MEPDWLTDEALAQLEELSAAGSSGPWIAFTGPGIGGGDFIRLGGSEDELPDMYVRHDGQPAPVADLDLIAAARSSIDALIDEVKRRRSDASINRGEWHPLPDWLVEPSAAVMADLQGCAPVEGISLAVTEVEGDDGVVLGLFEAGGGGGRFVGRHLGTAALLACIAEILQDELAETAVAWGQARPPCPHHPHPARPVVREDEAWWVCEPREEALFRIGAGEVLRK